MIQTGVYGVLGYLKILFFPSAVEELAFAHTPEPQTSPRDFSLESSFLAASLILSGNCVRTILIFYDVGSQVSIY